MSFLEEYVNAGFDSLPINLPPGAIAPQALQTYEQADNSVLTIVNGIPAWGAMTLESLVTHTHSTSEIVSGTFDDARIAESNVTQHEAALSLTFTQLTDSIADAQVPESAITQHEAAINHNALDNLTTGDVHTQYALLAGRAGGQTLYGGTASGDDLLLYSTSHGTKGYIRIPGDGVAVAFEVSQVNNNTGLGITA